MKISRKLALFLIMLLVLAYTGISLAAEENKAKKFFDLHTLTVIALEEIAHNQSSINAGRGVERRKVTEGQEGGFAQEILKGQAIEKALLDASQDPNKMQIVPLILSDKKLSKKLEGKTELKNQITENMIGTLSDKAIDATMIKKVFSFLDEKAAERVLLNLSAKQEKQEILSQLLSDEKIKEKVKNNQELNNKIEKNIENVLNACHDNGEIIRILQRPTIEQKIIGKYLLSYSTELNRLDIVSALLAQDSIKEKLKNSPEVIEKSLDNMTAVLISSNDVSKVKNILGNQAVDKTVLAKVLLASSEKINALDNFSQILTDPNVSQNLAQNPQIEKDVLKNCLIKLSDASADFVAREFINNPAIKQRLAAIMQNDASMAELVRNAKLDKNAPLRFNEESCHGFAVSVLSQDNNIVLASNEDANDVTLSFNPEQSRIKSSFKTGQQSFATDWNNTSEYQGTMGQVDKDNYFYANDLFTGVLPADQKFQYLMTGKWKQKNANVEGNWLVGRFTNDLPSKGTATYTGAVVGNLQNGNDLYNTTGVLTLTANLGEKTLNGSFKNMLINDAKGEAAKDSAGKQYNPWKAALNANWSGNQISGDIIGENIFSTTFDRQNGEITGGLTANGNFQGAFFGPQGQEIGGNWGLQGNNLQAKGLFAGSKNFSVAGPNDGEIWKGFAFGTVHRFNSKKTSSFTSYGLGGLFISNDLDDVQFNFQPSQGKVSGHIKVAGDLKTSTLYPNLNAKEVVLDLAEENSYYSNSNFKAGTFNGVKKEHEEQKIGPKGHGFTTDDGYLDTSFYHYLQAGVWGLHSETNDDPTKRSGYQVGDCVVGNKYKGAVVTDGNVIGGSGWLAGRLTPDNQIPLVAKATYTGALTGIHTLENNSTPWHVAGKVALTADFVQKTLSGDLLGIYRTDSKQSETSAHIKNGGWQGNKITGDLEADNGWKGEIRGAFFGPKAEELGGNWTLKGGKDYLAGLFAAKSEQGNSENVPKQGDIWNGFTAAVGTSEIMLGKDAQTEAKIKDARQELSEAKVQANKKFFQQYEDFTKFKYKRTDELYDNGHGMNIEHAEEIAGQEAQALADQAYEVREGVLKKAEDAFRQKIEAMGIKESDLLKRYKYDLATGDTLDSVQMIFDPGTKNIETNRSIEFNATKDGQKYNFYVQGADPASKWNSTKDINIANWFGKAISMKEFAGEYLTGGLWYAKSQWKYNIGYEVLLNNPIASWWVAGKVTPDIAIPVSGKAYYTGNVMGTMKDKDFNFSLVAGTCNLTADFGQRKMLGDFSMQNGPIQPWGATVDASWQNGTNGITGNLAASNGMNGNLNGAFFGPNATEMGGNWRLNGVDGAEAVGIFGAQEVKN